MIERREGLTDINHLAGVMVKETSLNASKDFVLDIINRYLERCVEIYLHGKLSGYVLIMNVNGERSFHGYKLIEGYSLSSFRIAQNILKDYADIAITTTMDKVQVNRMAKLLGFREVLKVLNIVKLERIHDKENNQACIG